MLQRFKPRSLVGSLLWVVVRAAAFAVSVLVGYRVGMALMSHLVEGWWLIVERQRDGTLGVEQLDFYPRFLGFYEGSLLAVRNQFEIVPYDFISQSKEVFAVLFGLALIGILASRFVPLRFAPGRLYNSPRSARNEIMRAWRRHLRVSTGSAMLLVIGFVLGYAAYVFDNLYTLLALVSVVTNVPTGPLPTMNQPVWHFLAAPDGIILVLGSVIGPIAMTTIIARRGLAQDDESLSRWCPRCGFPKPSSATPSSDRSNACTECGHDAEKKKTDRRNRQRFYRRLGLMAVALVLGLLLVQRYAPRVVYGVVRPSQSSLEPYIAGRDRAFLLAGTVLRVERPERTIWLLLDANTRSDTTWSSRLRIIAQPITNQPRSVVVDPAHETIQFEGKGTYSFSTPEFKTFSLECFVQERGVGAWTIALSPSGATSIQAVAPGDHPAFEEEK